MEAIVFKGLGLGVKLKEGNWIKKRGIYKLCAKVLTCSFKYRVFWPCRKIGTNGILGSCVLVSNFLLIRKSRVFESMRLAICCNCSFNLLVNESPKKSFYSFENLELVLGIT